MNRIALFSIALMLSAFAGTANAQSSDECPSFDTAGVVAVEGIPMDELYQRAKHWFVNRFKDAQEVIQLDDPANGTIIGKGYFGNGLFFTMEIACKEGRYRYNLHGIYHEDHGVRAVYGTVIENTDYGAMYNCKFCSSFAQSWRIKHPNQHGYEKECTKRWLPLIKNNVRGTVSSVINAMANATPSTDDW